MLRNVTFNHFSLPSMASDLTRPPSVDMSDLTESDLRASASLHTQIASSLREILKLRTSLLDANHELGELRQKLRDAEEARNEDQHELDTCKERLHAVEDELQQTKCELEELKSSRKDMELRLEDTEASLKAAQRLLGEYVLEINKLEGSRSVVPGSLTRRDASVATNTIGKRARSPSLETLEPYYTSPGEAKIVSRTKSPESTPARTSLDPDYNTTPARPSKSPGPPTPPRTSDPGENSAVPVKRRKVGVDDEVMDVEMEDGGDSMGNHSSDTTLRVNDTQNAPPGSPPPASLSSDSNRLEAPSENKEAGTTDSLDADPVNTDSRSAIHAGCSPSTNLRTLNAQINPSPPADGPPTDVTNEMPASTLDAPSSSGSMPPASTPTDTSTNHPPISPTLLPATTTNPVPILTSSMPTTSVAVGVLPPSRPAQTTAVNAAPLPRTTARVAPLTMPTVPTVTHAPLENAPPPSANNIQNGAIAKVAEMLSKPPSTSGTVSQNANLHTHDQDSPLPASTSTKMQQISFQTAMPGHQAPRSVLPRGSNMVLELPHRKIRPVAGPSRPLPGPNLELLEAYIRKNPINPGHDNLLLDSLHTVQRESQYLDTSSMPPALASMVHKYLPSTKAKIFTTFPGPLKTEVPCAFLISAYGGGSDQQFFQIFRKDKDPKGAIERRAVFPQLELNPAMPTAPGHPGLLFAWRHEILENSPWSVFAKGVSGSGELYLGDYVCELAGRMTAMEFSGLEPLVKFEWAKALLAVKHYDVYVSMRARIALRKHGCIPLEDKNKEDALISQEINAVKANTGRPIDSSDIIGALERGDEGIDIIRMTCTTYDHAFAKDMKRKFMNYNSLASATSAPSSSGGTATGSNAPASAATPTPPNAPLPSHQDRPVRKNRRSEVAEEEYGIEEDPEFKPVTPLLKTPTPSDRKLRPRAIRAIITPED